jgi:hypothetical protein
MIEFLSFSLIVLLLVIFSGPNSVLILKVVSASGKMNESLIEAPVSKR